MGSDSSANRFSRVRLNSQGISRRGVLKIGGGLTAAALGGHLLGDPALGQVGTPAASPAPIPQYATNPEIEGDITF